MRILKAEESLTDTYTALALGFFDGVHLGHQAVIGCAIEMAGEGVIPAVFTFGTQSGAPGAKLSAGLLQTPTLKEETLRELGVGCLYWPGFETIRSIDAEDFVKTIVIGKLRARAVCCGRDFRFGKGAVGDITLLERLLASAGVRLCVVPDVMLGGEPVSSTRIRNAVMAGDMELATALLGRPFAIDFPVERGRQLGRRIGLPTANQRFASQIVLPRFGVYAARVTVGGKTYPAVSNVGVKPTVGSDGVLCESYIHGFLGNIYGERIKTELLGFLRPEKKFSSTDELRDTIIKDAEAVFNAAP